MIETYVVRVAYIVAAALFIFSLKWLGHPATARRGVKVGELGMALAIAGTLVRHEILSYQWILVGFTVGTAIGVPLAVYLHGEPYGRRPRPWGSCSTTGS